MWIRYELQVSANKLSWQCPGGGWRKSPRRRACRPSTQWYLNEGRHHTHTISTSTISTSSVGVPPPPPSTTLHHTATFLKLAHPRLLTHTVMSRFPLSGPLLDLSVSSRQVQATTASHESHLITKVIVAVSKQSASPASCVLSLSSPRPRLGY